MKIIQLYRSWKYHGSRKGNWVPARYSILWFLWVV